MKQWTCIRSNVIKDGHLVLALTADGGIYEFEPLATTPKLEARGSLVTQDGSWIETHRATCGHETRA